MTTFKSAADYKKLLESLKPEDGATLVNGEIVTYPSGWQVAHTDNRMTDINLAAVACTVFAENLGIWVDKCGAFCIDHSFHYDNIEEAAADAEKYHQESALDWSTGDLHYFK